MRQKVGPQRVAGGGGAYLEPQPWRVRGKEGRNERRKNLHTYKRVITEDTNNLAFACKVLKNISLVISRQGFKVLGWNL